MPIIFAQANNVCSQVIGKTLNNRPVGQWMGGFSFHDNLDWLKQESVCSGRIIFDNQLFYHIS